MTCLIQWLSSLGATAKVLVVDSGLISSPTLIVKESKNFTHQPLAAAATHGTNMASIIASRDPMCIGIAPYCDLYVAKSVTNQSLDWKACEQALEWGLELGVDVINMSFGMSSLSDKFKRLLKELDMKGVICLAAHSQLSGFSAEPSVCCVGRPGPFSRAEALVVGESLRRGANGSFTTVRGTSVSTAILSGVAACAKSLFPTMTRTEFIRILSDN